MNLSRVLAGLAVLAMLCACTGPGPKPTQSPGPSPCQVDMVTPVLSPLIQIQPMNAATPSTITARVRLTCGTTLNVTRNGSAVARFGTVAACQLVRYRGAPTGTLISREPTGMLFSLNAGQVWCRDFTSQPEQALVCGIGTVYLTTITTKWDATCASDHVFHVAVYAGSVQVHYPKAKKNVTLHPGLQLAYDPATGRATPPSRIIFSNTDVSIFSALGP